MPRTAYALASAALLAALLAACSTTPVEPLGPPARDMIFAVSTGQRLLQFNAGQPQQTLSNRALAGLAPGDRVLAIDYRVAKGQLYALGASGQLYRIDTQSATASPVGTPQPFPKDGATEWGMDFNPTVDRIRVVNDAGLNLRLHPDSGAIVDGTPDRPGLQFDSPLAYDVEDPNAGKKPALVAAAYTYNKVNDKLTTNYALDGRLGVLVHQGSREGQQPVISPNTGRLFTVGSLGIGPFQHATLDISDLNNAAYAAITQGERSVWYRIDLATGHATRIGSIAGGPVVGAAIEP